MMGRTTRRQFLWNGAKAITVATVGTVPVAGPLLYLAVPRLTDGPLNDSDLNLARYNESLRDDFCKKFYVAAKAEGLLSYCPGVVYDHDRRGTEQYIRKFFPAYGVPQKDLDRMLHAIEHDREKKQQILSGEVEPEAPATVHVVSPIQMTGRKVQSPLFVSSYLFDESIKDPRTGKIVLHYRNIDEIMSVADHESVHTTDVFLGYVIDDKVIVHNTFAHSTSLQKFKKALAETRGYHRQLLNLHNRPRAKRLFKEVAVLMARRKIWDLNLYNCPADNLGFAPYAEAQLAILEREGVVIRPNENTLADKIQFTFLNEN